MNGAIGKRVIAAALACMLGVSSTALAEPQLAAAQGSTVRSAQQRREGTIKIIAGLASAGFGALLVAASHESASGEIFGERYEISATNKGGMIAGLGLLGAGGALVFLGVKDRRDAQNSPSIGIIVGRRTGVFLTRRW